MNTPISQKAELTKLPLGVSDFKKLITNNYYCVDKSLFIADIISDYSEIILITRPRRFGKTLNLSMLRYFLDSRDGKANRELFDGLNIAKEAEFCAKHQGQYPVIFLTLKKIKQLSYEEMQAEMAELMYVLYQQFDYLLESNALSEIDKETFQLILKGKATKPKLKNSLKALTSYLHAHHKVKPIVLIDEYDEPLHAAYSGGYYQEAKDFMRVFLGEALKDNVDLHKAVVTGILRVSQASIFSGLNNVTVYTVLDNRYSSYFGFSAEEVNELHKVTACPQSLSSIQHWYNGYQFGGDELYNPWSIINVMARPRVLKPHWINTAENVFIKRLIGEAPLGVRQQLTALLQGETVNCSVDETIIFSEIHKTEMALWTLLVFSGYLNVVDWQIARNGLYQAKVKIPNHEVMTLYVRIVGEWFNDSGSPEHDYQQLLAGLANGNAELFQAKLQAYINESGSYFDFNQHTHEQVYHALVLGLVAGLSDRYIIKSNRESGDGRYDVMLLPKDLERPGIVLEFKTATNGTEEHLMQTVQTALEQIIQTNYVTELQQAGVSAITAMGLAFNAKQVRVLASSVA